MRDNGYRNAAYALAELMDNSIQAGAKNVELLCGERPFQLTSSVVNRISEIAVLDDGHGMDEATLQIALQFGNGTHLNDNSAGGIGKFGMGLPSSSISQAKRVEVWSWQKGHKNAIYSYLDVDEILDKKMESVPVPTKNKLPDKWLDSSNSFGTSGTLVVWSKIDRCIWKTATSIIDNSEFLIGRMYRRFIHSSIVNIRMVSFNLDNNKVTNEKLAQANDPGYLLKNTSCPDPYDKKSLFEKLGDDSAAIYKPKIRWNGGEHEVTVTYSLAKKDARKDLRNAGGENYGKHAARNVGVSIVRAGRELDLDQSWTISYDTRERWWGVEVEFPPALDELFGVTNNKQSANNFAELSKLDWKILLKDGKSTTQLKKEYEQTDDPKAPLLDLAHKIDQTIGSMRDIIKAQTANSSEVRHDDEDISAEKKATQNTKERQEKGHEGTSDADERNLSDDEKRKELEESIEEMGVDHDSAQSIVDRAMKEGLKYVFVRADIQSSAFFSVRPKGGKIVISINVNHPAYDNLVEVLEEDTRNFSEDELRDRLFNAMEGLKLVLMAWARFEDEQPDGELKNVVQESRQDWGKIARRFLGND